MSMYGHNEINIDALKRWANSLSVDKITTVDIGGKTIVLNDATKKLLDMQTQLFIALVNKLGAVEDWKDCLYAISPVFQNAFIRIDDSSIRIADFYECFLEPSNMKTYKKIIKGYDYVDVGSIDIYDNDKIIATIGVKSDLIWSTFFEYFISTNDFCGSIDHVYSNDEQILSIQLFDIENKTIDQLVALVNKILLRVSLEYDMDFNIFKVDPVVKQIGDDTARKMQLTPTEYELVPMLYLNNAISSPDERLAYLSYYQVIEYFFVRSQNYFFLGELSKINTKSVDHKGLRKVLAEYKKTSTEREALKLVFLKSIDVVKFKDWINSNSEYNQIYCSSPKLNIDISKDDKKIISHIVERVYSYRCSIAHAKGDVDEYIAIPSLSNQEIAKELPLLKYLAVEVIEKCSEN